MNENNTNKDRIAKLIGNKIVIQNNPYDGFVSIKEFEIVTKAITQYFVNHPELLYPKEGDEKKMPTKIDTIAFIESMVVLSDRAKILMSQIVTEIIMQRELGEMVKIIKMLEMAMGGADKISEMIGMSMPKEKAFVEGYQ